MEAVDQEVHIEREADIAAEVPTMDWGVLVVESQGGVEVFVEGLNEADAAALLRKAAQALDPVTHPGW